MKTFKTQPENNVDAIVAHLASQSPDTLVLDAGHLASTPIDTESQVKALLLAAQIRNKIEALGIKVVPQFVVENPDTPAADISAQQDLSVEHGFDLGDPLFETEVHPTALALMAQLRQKFLVYTDEGITWLEKPRGRIHTAKLPLAKEGVPSGALMDAALIQMNAGKYAKAAMATILPGQFSGQQQNANQILKGLGYDADYTSILIA